MLDSIKGIYYVSEEAKMYRAAAAVGGFFFFALMIVCGILLHLSDKHQVVLQILGAVFFITHSLCFVYMVYLDGSQQKKWIERSSWRI